MFNPDQSEQFEQDYVSVVVREHDGTVPVMSRAFCEDIRYWSDGTEDPVGDDRVFLRRPQAATFVPVEPREGLEMGVLYLPDEWAKKMDLMYTPMEIEFLMTRPSYASQLERFY